MLSGRRSPSLPRNLLRSRQRYYGFFPVMMHLFFCQTDHIFMFCRTSLVALAHRRPRGKIQRGLLQGHRRLPEVFSRLVAQLTRMLLMHPWSFLLSSRSVTLRPPVPALWIRTPPSSRMSSRMRSRAEMLPVMCGPISTSVSVTTLDDEQTNIFERNLGTVSSVAQA